MYAISFYAGPNSLLIQATKFKVNKAGTLVTFKKGCDNVGLFKLSEIKSITKITEHKTSKKFKVAEKLGVI